MNIKFHAPSYLRSVVTGIVSLLTPPKRVVAVPTEQVKSPSETTLAPAGGLTARLGPYWVFLHLVTAAHLVSAVHPVPNFLVLRCFY